jgi:DDE superfamily endonuclease
MPPKRPSNGQKKQRRYYSGKKKRHTLKPQLVVEKSTRCILCLSHDKGRRHDFRLFKTSKVHLHPETEAVVDSGYQGLQRRHAKTSMPKKRSKKNPLSATDKARNRDISSERVLCENVIAILKRFKIIADRYRNRRRRFGLRFFLIAAIYNKELQAA